MQQCMRHQNPTFNGCGEPAFVGCRFSPIESRCVSSIPDTSPYGVDSVFKLGSVNFNPDLYDPAGAHLH